MEVGEDAFSDLGGVWVAFFVDCLRVFAIHPGVYGAAVMQADSMEVKLERLNANATKLNAPITKGIAVTANIRRIFIKINLTKLGCSYF